MKKVNLLSRAEMRKVMGGVADETIGNEEGPNCTSKCTKDSDCSGGDNSCKKCATGAILKGTCITAE
jgi:hypothetical protein